MAATTHTLNAHGDTQKSIYKSGGHMIARALARFAGVAFLFSALGMWFAPGASWAADIALMKLAVSFFFAIIGVTFILCADNHPSPDPK